MWLSLISLCALLLSHGITAFTAEELTVAETNQVKFSIRMTINETARMIQHFSNVKAAYYEFGMGGSTHLACAFLPPSARLYSMDSNQKWVRNTAADPCIQKMIAEGRASVKLVNIGETGEWGMPVGSTHMHLWADYSTSIVAYKDENVDLVLVDGRFRIACALESWLQFPQATIVMHDFYDPYHILDYVKLLEVFEKVESTDTLISLRMKPSVSRKTILAMLEDHRRVFGRI